MYLRSTSTIFQLRSGSSSSAHQTACHWRGTWEPVMTVRHVEDIIIIDGDGVIAPLTYRGN